MIGHCEFCNKKLGNDTRVDMRFCSDEHRIKFHNAKRQVKSLFQKALKAIDDLDEIAEEKSLFSDDAKMYMRRLYLRLTVNEKLDLG